MKPVEFMHSFLSFLRAQKKVMAGITAMMGLLFFLLWSMNRAAPVGVVNVTAIIDQFVKSKAHQNLSIEIQKEHVKNFGLHLEAALQTIAKKQHVVLLPSEAVIAGAHDYTAAVEDALNGNKS